MSLLDKLLAKTNPEQSLRWRVLARVLLDDAGRVQAVQLKRGCGDPAIDERALTELQNGHYPPTRLGSKTSRRWHDVRGRWKRNGVDWGMTVAAGKGVRGVAGPPDRNRTCI